MYTAILKFSDFPEELSFFSALKQAKLNTIELSINNIGVIEELYASLILVGEIDKIPISSELRAFFKKHSEQHKPILTIGGVSAYLAQTGLIPGLAQNQVGLSFTKDADYLPSSQIRLSKEYQRNVFTRYLSQNSILPIGKAAGYFTVPPALWVELIHQGLVLFQYCDSAGLFMEGSQNVAAIANKAGTNLAIASYPNVYDALFQSLREFLENPKVIPALPLHYTPRGLYW